MGKLGKFILILVIGGILLWLDVKVLYPVISQLWFPLNILFDIIAPVVELLGLIALYHWL